MAISAAQALELLERSYAYDAVQAPAIANEQILWVGTSLSIAGTPLLIGEGELDEIIETPQVVPIPGTKPWVMGVASHKGGLLPIVSGDALFRKRPYAGRLREYCMVIRRTGFYFGITLSGIERDLKFPIENRDMHHPVDADFAGLTLGGFKHGDKFLAILDIDKLVADSELSDACAAEPDSTEGKTNE
jgi:twitching motility protein PilI